MAKKRRSVKEVLEQDSPDHEEAYLKYPGEEPVRISDDSKKDKYKVNHDESKIQNLFKQHFPKFFNYTHIHNHSYSGDDPKHDKNLAKYPSGADIEGFLNEPTTRKAAIALKDSDTKKVVGYFVMKKTRKTPIMTPKREEELSSRLLKYYWAQGISRANYNSEKAEKEFDQFAKDYHINYRFVPAENTPETRERFRNKHKARNLEAKTLTTVALISIIIGFAFISTANITGNVISDNPNTINWIGLSLTSLGILGMIYLKLKNK